MNELKVEISLEVKVFCKTFKKMSTDFEKFARFSRSARKPSLGTVSIFAGKGSTSARGLWQRKATSCPAKKLTTQRSQPRAPKRVGGHIPPKSCASHVPLFSALDLAVRVVY